MIPLLALILLIGVSCAEAQKVKHPGPQDFRLRYASPDEIQALTSSGEAEVRFDERDIRMRIPVSGEDTVGTVLTKVLDRIPEKDRSGGWYATIAREKEIKTILPWFEKGSAPGLAELVVSGDLILLHEVRR